MESLDLVVKIGSMALIQKDENAIDYNIFQRLGGDLRPGMILVTSGATEIGRLDYLKRTGHELTGVTEQDKVDYSAQGQTILMNTYRQFICPEYGIRQVLVEHTHFNDPLRREHIHRMLLRAAAQEVIPIINYNDPVSDEEVRKMELASRRAEGMEVVECVDNDETASQIACLVKPKILVILTGVDGIYKNKDDKETLVREICGASVYETVEQVELYRNYCDGASRKGAHGARAKLGYVEEPLKNGTTVFIANSKYNIEDIIKGNVPSTKIYTR